MKDPIKENDPNSLDLIYRKGLLYEREYVKPDNSIERIKIDRNRILIYSPHGVEAWNQVNRELVLDILYT